MRRLCWKPGTTTLSTTRLVVNPTASVQPGVATGLAVTHGQRRVAAIHLAREAGHLLQLARPGRRGSQRFRSPADVCHAAQDALIFDELSLIVTELGSSSGCQSLKDTAFGNGAVTAPGYDVSKLPVERGQIGDLPLNCSAVLACDCLDRAARPIAVIG